MKQHKKQTGIRNLVYANLGLICLVSCSTTFQLRPKKDSIKNAAIVPVAPAWLEKIKKNVDNFHSADLFPKESLNYVPPKIIKSKYDKILKGKLAGHGSDFEEAAKKNGIPVDLLIAICLHEVGPEGKSKMLLKYNNVAGNLVKDKKTGKWSSRQFASVQESIQYTARNLRLNYFNKGLNTIPKIKTRYAPAIAENDPKKINRSWAGSVARYQAYLQTL